VIRTLWIEQKALENQSILNKYGEGGPTTQLSMRRNAFGRFYLNEDAISMKLLVRISNAREFVASARMAGQVKCHRLSRPVRNTSAIPFLSPACNSMYISLRPVQDVAAVRQWLNVHVFVLVRI
jgi:hypothetical protein